MNIEIIDNVFKKEDGTFDKDSAMKLSGIFAGVCYDEEGFNHKQKEAEEYTMKRVNRTLKNGHHSVYDHITINLNIENIPKILAMFLNNEKEYTTSEKSLRYTSINQANEMISIKEVELYNKWKEIFNNIIKENYNEYFTNSKIENLSKENARYLTTVFIPTQMIYSTSFRQLNYLCGWMEKYINESKTDFDKKVSIYMREFIDKLKEKNLLDERLMVNDKNRTLSLITDKEPYEDYFSDVYKTSYKASFAQLAQAQRHRTLDYSASFLKDYQYFIPPILKSEPDLVNEWCNDMKEVESVYPQGQLVNVNERGYYENFILKCKERLCSAAQLEVMLQTKDTLNKYKSFLQDNNDELYEDIIKYSHGARCTFPDYNCPSDCKFLPGKTLRRKI